VFRIEGLLLVSGARTVAGFAELLLFRGAGLIRKDASVDGGIPVSRLVAVAELAALAPDVREGWEFLSGGFGIGLCGELTALQHQDERNGSEEPLGVHEFSH